MDYHSFAGEIVCGRWSIALNSRYLWGKKFYWIYDCTRLKRYSNTLVVFINYVAGLKNFSLITLALSIDLLPWWRMLTHFHVILTFLLTNTLLMLAFCEVMTFEVDHSLIIMMFSIIVPTLVTWRLPHVLWFLLLPPPLFPLLFITFLYNSFNHLSCCIFQQIVHPHPIYLFPLNNALGFLSIPIYHHLIHFYLLHLHVLFIILPLNQYSSLSHRIFSLLQIDFALHNTATFVLSFTVTEPFQSTSYIT